MSFLHEKQSRYFFAGIIGLSVLLLILCGCLCIGQSRITKKMLLSREETIAASLLEQGIAPDIVAVAIANPKDNGKGKELLEQLGYTENTAAYFLPAVSGYYFHFYIMILTGSFLFILLLFMICIIFLSSRERLYRQASKIILQFTEGNFTAHLPRLAEGTLYQLFAAVDNLANALQSKSEAEHQSKQFLKNTISDISHQLKTPLAALNIYNDIIINEPHNVSAVTEFSQKTTAALGRIEQLIQSLLKITRLDTRSIIFDKTSCTITELVAQATEELIIRSEFENKQIIINGSQEDRITCDLPWTSEAIGNIVKNALDYTASGGNVCILWESSPSMVRITITDDGVGINQEDIHHIFKRFYRSKNAADTNGIGLGLPLAKAIIEGQGGLVSVQSMPGNGTTFTLSFLTGL